MATKDLTPRQQQIKKLTQQGKKAPAIAKELGITENAVYQHLRAIRGGAKKSSGSTSRSRSRATAGRQSARKRTRARTAASRPAPAPKVPATAEELLTAEIQAANEAKTEALAQIESLKGQIEAAETAIGSHDAEIATKTDVLAVLTGEKVAQAKPKARPARKRSSAAKKATGQSGAGKGAQAASGQQAAPEAPSNGGAASTPAPASQAEREATADHDGPAPAEQPQEQPQEAAPATA